jgi:TolB-like protein
VAAVAIIAVAAVILTRGPREIDPIAVAVLPLSVEGGAGEIEWFSSGMTDALITELAQIENVRVICKRSVVRLASDQSLTEIAQDLDVSFVVDGSVTKFDDQVIITVRLADVRTDQYVWAERFETSFSEVLTTQRKIAGAIAEELLGEVPPTDKTRLATEREVNPEVYEAYLRGMHHIAKYTTDEVEKGLVYLHEAVDLDAGDALAWAGLAIGYITIDHGPTASDARDMAMAAARRAVRLDSTLAEAWAALAMAEAYYGWDWQRAARAFERASELNPSLAENHYHYAWILLLTGRKDEALVEHELAVELDPLFAPQTAWMGAMYRMAGEYDKALEQVERAQELGDRTGLSHLVRGKVYFDMGRVDDAIAEHQRMVEVNPVWHGLLCVTYARAGRSEEARAIAERIESKGPNPVEAFQLVYLFGQLGDADKAFEWLGYQPHHVFVPWLASEWAPIDPVSDDPRYESFLRELNLPKDRPPPPGV